MATKNELGMKIAEERMRKGLTQEQLAERIGCQSNTLSRWEIGATNMIVDVNGIAV